MTNSTLTVNFGASNPTDQSSLDLKVSLAQERIPETSKYAEIGDLMPMWNNAINGKTAYEYIYDTCPYATIKDGVLTITMRFFVYPSVISLPYRLVCDFGTISPGILIQQSRSTDVLLNGVDTLQLDTVIDGKITPQMPVFNRDGEEIYPEITLENGIITASESCYTALRLNGLVSCFQHDLVMVIQKTTAGYRPGARIGLKISNLTNSVTAEWVDENDKLQKTTMGIEIPPCVEAMLEVCEDDLPGEEVDVDKALDSLIVYYNTCTGEIIKKVVVEGESDDD